MPAVREELLHLLGSTSPVLVEGCIRPGCTHLLLTAMLVIRGAKVERQDHCHWEVQGSARI